MLIFGYGCSTPLKNDEIEDKDATEWSKYPWCEFLSQWRWSWWGGGVTPISNGYGCKAHTSKDWGIRWEHSLKNKGSLGEKPNFGSKLGGIGWECYFDLSVSALKAGIWRKKKVVENGKDGQFVDEMEPKSSFLWQPNAKHRRSLGESDRRAHISPKMWGLWVTAETISKKFGVIIGWQQHKIGGLWSLTSASPP